MNENDGARLGFGDLQEWGVPPQEPPLHEGDEEREFPAAILKPESAIVNNSNQGHGQPRRVFLMKKPDIDPAVREQNRNNGIAEDGVTRAYVRLDRKRIELKEPSGWGAIVFAIVHPRSDSVIGDKIVFDSPTENEAEHVVIKILNREVVRWQLGHGGRENPYKEISLMEQLGDGIHVLQIIEVLQENDYIFIVMPRGVCTLGDVIPLNNPLFIPPLNNPPMSRERAHRLFVKILRILEYLQENNVCHHDLSLGNFLLLPQDNLVLIDFGMAVRLPTRNLDGVEHRTLVTRQGMFGTPPFMCPEVFEDEVFDGVAADLWSAAAILYTMLTNLLLCNTPHYNDICFRYLVYAGAPFGVANNQRVIDSLIDGQDNTVLAHARAISDLSPESRALFENMLRLDPSWRWTLSQAIESEYVRE